MSLTAFSMNISPKTKLALMRSLREKKNPLQKGFTLIELMIVVAIVGILSAVALPNFLGARAAASAGAAVGEVIGISKECATFIASGGVGALPAAPTTSSIGVTCGTGGGTVSKTFQSGAQGVQCLGTAVTSASGSGTVKVTIAATTGAMTCAFS
jgi:type IV pilus assembly protein PilA